MQQELSKHDQLFQLIPTSGNMHVPSNILTIGRYLVGRTETCDIVIPIQGISAVHAVLEVTPRGVNVYDMNSKNGTLIDGNKVVAKRIELNGRVTFGSIEFILKKYSADPALPPVLPSLDPIKGAQRTLNRTLPSPPSVSTNSKNTKKKRPILPANKSEILEDMPYIVYPLAADPNSAYSEYIFEDTTNLYPIFKYEINKQAVEVIILFKDNIFSVDYLPEKDGVYKIAGLTSKKDTVEFPYLAASESIPFIEIQKGNCIVNQLNQYKILQLIDDKIIHPTENIVNLQDNDIVKLSNQDLEIFVRRVSSPPKVKNPPFFRRDKDLRKYLLLMLFLVLLPFFALNFYEVDEKLKDEKDPERIATILYKQRLTLNKNQAVESVEKKPVKKQEAPKKPVVKKEEPKKEQAPSQKTLAKETKPVPTPGATKAPKVQQVKAVKDPIPKTSSTVKPNPVTKSAVAAKSTSAKTQKAIVDSKSQGRVEAYKSFDFKSSINTLMAKGGSIKGATTANTSSGELSQAQVSGGVATDVSKASVGKAAGSLAGSTVGKLGESKGTKGLSAKSGVYTAGIPSETVVLGSMDPDVIRRILRDNIPFFRSCYQTELNANPGQDISGTIRLVFTIGASGHVSQAGVDGRTSLPSDVKRCVVGVLRGIEFPRPMGGGTVDVKQPFNFFPKKL